MISLEPVDPAEAPAALGGYTQALSVRGASQLLFVSGQIPVRREILADHRPALTVIISTIYDPAWLLEIEAIAAT